MADKGQDNVGFEIELDDKPENRVRSRSSTATSSGKHRDDDDDETARERTRFGGPVENLWHCVRYEDERRNYWIKMAFLVIVAILYNGYFAATVWYAVHYGKPIDFCDGVGFHIVLTGFVYLCLFYFQIVKPYWGKAIHKSFMKPIGERYDRVWKYRSDYGHHVP